MSNELVSRLLDSFNELERCIAVTKSVLNNKPNVPSDVVERVNQYSGIVEKQRKIARDLKQHIASKDWDEVTRCVRLINALSSMIRDDAEAILASENENPATSDREYKVLC